MQLEEYFEFDQEGDRIRVKGTRIGIDLLIDAFNAGSPPEMIMRNYYPSLTLEQVYATITYYLHNKAEMDAYIQRVVEQAETTYQEYLKKEPSPVIQRLRALRAQQQSGVTPS
jgi:uncharacterized protein (DUF433 family)